MPNFNMKSLDFLLLTLFLVYSLLHNPLTVWAPCTQTEAPCACANSGVQSIHTSTQDVAAPWVQWTEDLQNVCLHEDSKALLLIYKQSQTLNSIKGANDLCGIEDQITIWPSQALEADDPTTLPTRTLCGQAFFEAALDKPHRLLVFEALRPLKDAACNAENFETAFEAALQRCEDAVNRHAYTRRRFALYALVYAAHHKHPLAALVLWCGMRSLVQKNTGFKYKEKALKSRTLENIKARIQICLKEAHKRPVIWHNLCDWQAASSFCDLEGDDLRDIEKLEGMSKLGLLHYDYLLGELLADHASSRLRTPLDTTLSKEAAFIKAFELLEKAANGGDSDGSRACSGYASYAREERLYETLASFTKEGLNTLYHNMTRKTGDLFHPHTTVTTDAYLKAKGLPASGWGVFKELEKLLKKHQQ